MFDAKTLAGWEGDPQYWRVQDAIMTSETATTRQGVRWKVKSACSPKWARR